MTGELALGLECESIRKPSQWTLLAKRFSSGVKICVITKNGIHLQGVVVYTWVSAYELGSLIHAVISEGSIELPTQKCLVLFLVVWLL